MIKEQKGWEKGQETKKEIKNKTREEQGSELDGQRNARNDENGAAKEKKDGCHKKIKTGQRTKKERKGTKQCGRRPKNQGKKGHKLGHNRAVQSEEKGW